MNIHIGKHMEEIALSALPRNADSESEEDSIINSESHIGSPSDTEAQRNSFGHNQITLSTLQTVDLESEEDSNIDAGSHIESPCDSGSQGNPFRHGEYR